MCDSLVECLDLIGGSLCGAVACGLSSGHFAYAGISVGDVCLVLLDLGIEFLDLGGEGCYLLCGLLSRAVACCLSGDKFAYAGISVGDIGLGLLDLFGELRNLLFERFELVSGGTDIGSACGYLLFEVSYALFTVGNIELSLIELKGHFLLFIGCGCNCGFKLFYVLFIFCDIFCDTVAAEYFSECSFYLIISETVCKHFFELCKIHFQPPSDFVYFFR